MAGETNGIGPRTQSAPSYEKTSPKSTSFGGGSNPVTRTIQYIGRKLGMANAEPKMPPVEEQVEIELDVFKDHSNLRMAKVDNEDMATHVQTDTSFSGTYQMGESSPRRNMPASLRARLMHGDAKDINHAEQMKRIREARKERQPLFDSISDGKELKKTDSSSMASSAAARTDQTLDNFLMDRLVLNNDKAKELSEQMYVLEAQVWACDESPKISAAIAEIRRLEERVAAIETSGQSYEAQQGELYNIRAAIRFNRELIADELTQALPSELTKTMLPGEQIHKALLDTKFKLGQVKRELLGPATMKSRQRLEEAEIALDNQKGMLAKAEQRLTETRSQIENLVSLEHRLKQKLKHRLEDNESRLQGMDSVSDEDPVKYELRRENSIITGKLFKLDVKKEALDIEFEKNREDVAAHKTGVDAAKAKLMERRDYLQSHKRLYRNLSNEQIDLADKLSFDQTLITSISRSVDDVTREIKDTVGLLKKSVKAIDFLGVFRNAAQIVRLFIRRRNLTSRIVTIVPEMRDLQNRLGVKQSSMMISVSKKGKVEVAEHLKDMMKKGLKVKPVYRANAGGEMVFDLESVNYTGYALDPEIMAAKEKLPGDLASYGTANLLRQSLKENMKKAEERAAMNRAARDEMYAADSIRDGISDDEENMLLREIFTTAPPSAEDAEFGDFVSHRLEEQYEDSIGEKTPLLDGELDEDGLPRNLPGSRELAQRRKKGGSKYNEV